MSIDCGGIAYDVLDRCVARLLLFKKRDDYAAFGKVLAEAHSEIPMRVISYCLMASHWHRVPWPGCDGPCSEKPDHVFCVAPVLVSAMRGRARDLVGGCMESAGGTDDVLFRKSFARRTA